MRPGGVLFFDLSTSVGWAYGDPTAALPIWGTWKLPSPKEDITETYNSFHTELTGALDRFDPSRVGRERPIPQSRNNIIAAEVTYGLHAILILVCCLRKIPLTDPSVDTIRSQVIGRARLTQAEEKIIGATVKNKIVAPWCVAQGWGEISDPDARDAAVGWAYEVGIRAPKKPKKRGAAIQESVLF